MIARRLWAKPTLEFHVQPDGAVIRPPMPDAPGHCGERPRLLGLRGPFSADEPRNAAHRFGASPSLVTEKGARSGVVKPPAGLASCRFRTKSVS